MSEATLRRLERDLPRIPMLSPALLAKQRAMRNAKPSPAKRPKPLHVALPGKVADSLRALAERRAETPQVLAQALLARLFEDNDDLAGELLEGCRAELFAGGHGRRPFGPAGTLTLRQCAVIHLIGSQADPDGFCRLGARRLGALMPRENRKSVYFILLVLFEKGLIDRGKRTGRGAPWPWRLTTTGAAVWQLLDGEAADDE